MNVAIRRSFILAAFALTGCVESSTGPGAEEPPPPPVVTAGPPPTVSPIGRIAFVSTRDDGTSWIYLSNPDGTGLTRLLPGTNPSWSPDGLRVAFTADFDGTPGLFTVAADGTDRRPLTGGYAYAPVWSPDGNTIVFHRDGEIFAIDADGTDERRLVGLDAVGRWTGVELHPGFDLLSVDDWSSDGRHLALWVHQFERHGFVLVVRADGSGPVPGAGVREGHSPSFTPDGSRLMYTRPVAAEWGRELVSVALDGSAETVHPLSPWVGMRPRWSPDGTNIVYHVDAAFTQSAGGCWERCAVRIWVADPITGNRRQLIPDDSTRAGTPYTDFGAVWAVPSR